MVQRSPLVAPVRSRSLVPAVGFGRRRLGRRALPLLVLFGSAACQQHHHRHPEEPPIGTSTYADDELEEEMENEVVRLKEHQDELADDALAEPGSSEETDSEDDVNDESAGPQSSSGDFEETNVLDPMSAEEKMLHRARKALAASKPVAGQHDLNVVLHQDVSDLTWILAVENRGKETVTLAALPSLIRFEVQPPKEEEEETESEEEEPAAATTKKKQTEKEPDPVICSGDPPKEISDDSQVSLEPGQIVVHQFDPRPLCEDSSVLTAGALIVPQYGWPLDTKKLWKGGKLTEVEVEQKAPFVAEWPEKQVPEDAEEESEADTPKGSKQAASDEADEDAEAEATSLKHLEANRFVLGETYPLSAVYATPRQEALANRSQEGGQSEGAHAERPPEPLAVDVLPMGSTWNPESDTVTVRIKNTSGESMRILLRRELVTYEVIGPSGLRSCRMEPSARSADPSHFSRLSPGSSRTMVTRLAEACPSGTFDEPGVYSVSARVQSFNSGDEHDLDAFVGSATTDKPTRFVVKGKQAEESAMPAMVVASMKPTAPLSPAARRRRALARPQDSSGPIDVGSLMAPSGRGNGNGRSNSPNPSDSGASPDAPSSPSPPPRQIPPQSPSE